MFSLSPDKNRPGGGSKSFLNHLSLSKTKTSFELSVWFSTNIGSPWVVSFLMILTGSLVSQGY
jgi:hypothetical protein